MSRPIEQPVTIARERDGTETTHPAFGQIRVNRASGRTVLYGSDFVHQDIVTIEIKASSLMRDLNRDWYFDRGSIIKVAMSEAQWAAFVSSFGVGGGVPCTLQYRGLEPIPGIPDPTPRTEQFSAELQDSFKGILARVDEMIAGAKTKAQASALALLKQDIEKNLPFVASQFEEHMEDTVEAAKAEIHGYAAALINRAGLEALTGGHVPLQLEYQSKGEIE